jgi:catechol 2,3-dioxygenase-like lactoylglutathione lyase family enzyme
MLGQGRFLEVSLPTPDILASLGFYRALGFSEVPVNDIRAHHYAAVTDGRIVLGLHGGGCEEPALTFVLRDLARIVPALAAGGTALAFQQLGDDRFNEAGFHMPDGQLVALVEAPTFSASGVADAAVPAVGAIASVILRSPDPDAAGGWLGAHGFDAAGDDRWRLGPLTLELAAGFPVPGPALRLPALTAGTRARLDAAGIAARRRPVGDVLLAPEGTWLVFG